MKVLLLHLDGKLPNIALMRIAAHHRALGDDVAFRRAPTVAAVEPELGDLYDRVYDRLFLSARGPSRSACWRSGRTGSQRHLPLASVAGAGDQELGPHEKGEDHDDTDC